MKLECKWIRKCLDLLFSAKKGKLKLVLRRRNSEEVALGTAPPTPPPPLSSPTQQAPSSSSSSGGGGKNSSTKSTSLLCCSSPFMFRSKRNALVKRLWKSRIRADSINNSHHRRQQQGSDEEHNETQGSFANSTTVQEQSDGATVVVDMELKSVAHSLLKRLKETQLSLLVEAVESRGGGPPTGCVLVPKGDIRVGRRTLLPNVFCCQLWRWSDVTQPFELKRLACCNTSLDDPAYVCSNPYHWSRLSQPESPPSYTRCALDWMTPEDEEETDPVSVATGGTNQYASYSSNPQGINGEIGNPKNYWCSLAYWELRTRVGRLFPVHKNMINVFSNLPHGEGLCLGTLAKQNQRAGESVRRTREKIGLGLCISNEADGVWAYNRSDIPVFVHSPTLQSPPQTSHPPLSRPSFTVYKVHPGYSIKVFDFEKSRLYQKLDKELSKKNDGAFTDGPFDPNSVRISFAKGWGPKYSRQIITSCPCWLEILLIPPR